MDTNIFSSRSRIETFQECQRRGYINFLWDKRGIVKRAASVYLSTGTYVHKGLEQIFRLAMKNIAITEVQIDEAVHIAITAYWKEITERGFEFDDGENIEKANENYIIMEQCALVEAFIRAFAVRVLPELLARFRVMDVEKEESVNLIIPHEINNLRSPSDLTTNSIDLSSFDENGDELRSYPSSSSLSSPSSTNIILQGRLDVVLEEIANNDIYIVSFKTAASWDRRQEKSNEHDNQGLSETFCLENRLCTENDKIRKMLENFGGDSNNIHSIHPKLANATNKYIEYAWKFLKPEKVMGVIMIYMIKGKRSESYTKPGIWEQHSPLIRGYRKLVGTEYEYAGSLWYDKPSNISGKGKLGKGWEIFNVWECEEVGFVKGWIAKAASNELGSDIIGDTFKIPAPYFRRQEHINSWVRQVKAIEVDIQGKIGVSDIERTVEYLDRHFPQTKKHCHYPTDCQYLDICYNREIFDDPIKSGKFIYRTPHHSREKKEHEQLYNIERNDNINKVGSTASFLSSFIKYDEDIFPGGHDL